MCETCERVSFSTAVQKDSGSKSGVVSMCISAMMNLANDKTVRHRLACRRSLWLASEELLVSCDGEVSVIRNLSSNNNDGHL